MASGIFYGTANDPNIRVRLEWSSTPNPASGESNVSASLYLRTISETVSGSGKFTINVGGAEKTESRYVTITSDTWVLAITYGSIYPHGDDGFATAVIQVVEGRITGDKDITVSASGKAKLDYIPGASSITSASDTVLGEKCVVKWIPASADYVYKLKFSIGTWEGFTDIISPGITSEYVYSDYSIPLDAAEQIKGVKGSMVVSLYTYLSKDSMTQVKYPKTAVITVTVPDNDSTKPTMTVMVSPKSTLSDPFDKLYIKGRTKVQADLSEGSGYYGASVVSRYMTVGGKTYSAPYISDFLPISGDTEVVCTVTDTRGFTREYRRPISVIDYDAPMLLPASAEKAVICARCDSTGALSESGTSLKIKARRGFSPVVASGVQNNRCAIRYRCVSDESSFDGDSGWKVILDGNSDEDTVDIVVGSGELSSEEAYTVQIGVIDSIGMSSTVQFAIPTDFAVVDIPAKRKGKRIGIGRYAEDSDEPGIDVGMPIHGGGVDNLTLGERIIATSSSRIDLDDIKAPGNYYTTNGQYIYKLPDTDGGFTLKEFTLEVRETTLEVRETDVRKHIKQTLSYGTTTWLRHYNSTEWSQWIRLVADVEFADYVVKEGTYEVKGTLAEKLGEWKYKKWKNGTYEMHGTFNLKPAQKTLVGGGIYRSEQITIAVPFDDITTAIVSGTATSSFFLAEGSLVNGGIGVILFIPVSYSIGRSSNVSLHVTGEYE